jgi:hypothetical protein
MSFISVFQLLSFHQREDEYADKKRPWHHCSAIGFEGHSICGFAAETAAATVKIKK